MNTGRFLSIPAEEYHAASRRGRYMSSLLAAIRESPELYRRKTSGEIVSSKDYGFIVKLQKSVWMHTAASALLDYGTPKATVRVEYSGVPGQMRMDWFSGEYGIVAPPRPATASSGSRATASASGISSRWRSTTPCCKKPRARAWQSVSSPWRRTSVQHGGEKLSEELPDQAEKVSEAALARCRKCLQTGEWPTGYQETKVITSL